MDTNLSHMIKGIAAAMVFKTLAEVINFNCFTLMLERIINCGPIVGVVVFQPEIRSALQFLGRKIHLKKRKSVNAHILLSIEKALRYMSMRKIGALITIERSMNLQEHIETGTHLDADVTGELLMNIFIPNAPLHDGAAIIRSYKIAAASTCLPLSSSSLPSKFGTRHRAALGISEVTDAITLVVSEETGEISVAYDSQLTNDLTVENCLQMVKYEMSWM